MANVDFRRGLVPVHRKDGGAPYVRSAPLASKYSTSLYVGQILTYSASGYAKAGAAETPADVIGVCAQYYAGSATTRTRINFWPHDHVFKCQSDGSKATTEATMLNMNVKVTGNGGGSTDSGLSTCEVSVTSAGRTDTMDAYPLRIVGKSGEIGNEWANTNVDLLVEFNPYGVNLTYQNTWA
jgi:hypothetical protein